MNQINLKDRTAIVTGGAQGIGRAVAERFVESGARVMLFDIDNELATATAEELGHDTEALRVDVTNNQAVKSATAETINRFGRVDILVNSAGITGPNTTTWDYPLDDWQRVIDVNLTGSFNCAQAITPHMIEQNYGRMVFIASVAGKEGNPNASAYSASKAGVIGLVKSLGKELADKDIAVNAITPAAARTALFDQMSPVHIDYMLSKIPRARFVETEEIANMVAWLASEENSFTTASVFDLSGGRATY